MGALRPGCVAFLTVSAVDRQGAKRRVPPAVPEADEERLRFEQCAQRRRLRVRPDSDDGEGTGGGDGASTKKQDEGRGGESSATT